ncbi:polysaccharide deacetylase family protein [Caldanaerovirga acetigignens]|uniref:polysaccharide deacetylase family protein n=1 Tax=Caldanaerovirga acetigignens TaxID=447595 RepID=UPI0013563848|nr:polysaccharide deacetylase family protein [Caldanaerovirga acetigignens]
MFVLTAIFGFIFGTALAFYTDGYFSHIGNEVYSPKQSVVEFIADEPQNSEEDRFDAGELNTLLVRRLLGRKVSPTWERKKSKVAYLTFDDGPSYNTPEILEILKEYGIKATFFVNGWNKKNLKEMLKMIYEDGHALGNHTYSHRYEIIYSSVENFMADLKRQEEMIYEAAGIRPKIVRFPGGSDNLVSLRFGGKDIMKKIADKLKEEGYIYVDWNASCGDAAKPPLSKDQMKEAVRRTTKGKNPVVLLLHDLDSKKTTLEILPWIIEYLQSEGYEFETIRQGMEGLEKVNRTDFWR